MWLVASTADDAGLESEGATLLSVPLVPCPWGLNSLPESRGRRRDGERDGQRDSGSAATPESPS